MQRGGHHRRKATPTRRIERTRNRACAHMRKPLPSSDNGSNSLNEQQSNQGPTIHRMGEEDELLPTETVLLPTIKEEYMVDDVKEEIEEDGGYIEQEPEVAVKVEEQGDNITIEEHGVALNEDYLLSDNGEPSRIAPMQILQTVNVAAEFHTIPTYRCEICRIGFAESKLYNKHWRSEHSNSKMARNLKCTFCGKDFSDSHRLRKHQRVHTGEKPYTCGICHKHFAQNENLTVHMRGHRGEKPYTCEACSRSFTTRSALVTHYRVHTGERPYQCTECGKAFTTSSYLVVHRRYHSNEKPFQCEHCDKQFKTRPSWKKHQVSHSHDRRFQCPDCKKSFKMKKSYNLHCTIGCYSDKVFRCSFCGKQSSDRSSLIRHVRLHTGEKPFGCDVCGVRYSDSTALKSHKRSHTNEKPYHCIDCDMYFKSPNNLSRHRKNRHTKKAPKK